MTASSANVDVRKLRQFLAVLDAGGVREAARRIHVAQPALSRTIAELEEELGLALFARTGRRMEPSPAALSLAVDARALLGQLEALVARARGLALGREGTLRLGTSPSATFHPRVPALVRAQRSAREAVDVELVEGSTADLLDALAGRALDAAFVRPGAGLARGLVGHVIERERLLAVVPVGHALARRKSVRVDELFAYPLLLPTPSLGSSLSELVMRLASVHEMRLTVAANATHVASLVHLVATGMGVAFVPASLRSLGTRGVRFLPVTGAGVRLPLVLVHHEEPSNPALAPFVALALGGAAKTR